MRKIGLAVLLAACMATLLSGQFRRLKGRGPGREGPAYSGPGRNPLVANISTLTDDGGRLDWSASRNLIAFDRIDEGGFYKIWVMRPDGSGQRCLTCDNPEIPKHNGNPAWHPSGRFIVFQAQNEFHGLLGKVTDYFANPGAGVNNDLWVMDSDGRRVWQLTHLPPKEGGVLHPHFSHDGNYLLWAERYSSKGSKWGLWRMKIARFTDNNGTPSISEERELRPGQQKIFYETHGFTNDDRKIVFSANLTPGQDMTDDDIYTLDLRTQELRDLTNTMHEWDEHAQISPSGRKILWMTNRDLPPPRTPYDIKSDYWMMNIDGSNPERLTYFNTPGSPEYVPGGTTCADSSWGPDGRHLAAALLEDTRHGKSRIVMITFRDPQ